MPTIYLIRHAEPALTGVMLGRVDTPLSDAGRLAARSHMTGLKVPIVYCSPLLRARETAAYIQSEQTLVLDGLTEIDYGEWSGKTWGEIETEWHSLARLKAADWLTVTPPGGEEWCEAILRVGHALGTVKHGPLPAAIVAHQGVNSAIAYLLQGLDPLTFKQKYGEIIAIELY